MAFGIVLDLYDAYASAEAWAWAFDYGDSEHAALLAAKQRCTNLLNFLCQEDSYPFANSCAAIAVSECPSGCSMPAHGVASAGTQHEASTAAIAQCESAARGDEKGTCRVATSDQGEPGVVCVGSAR